MIFPSTIVRVARFLSVGLLLSVSPSALAADRVVETVIGTGTKGFSGDNGPAHKAQLSNPFAVARGPDNELYLCDVDNHRIRRVDSMGNISTIAGNGTKGYSGDGGPATAAELNEPYEMAWDHDKNLYFVERMNHTVRKVDFKTGIISTIAGTGKAGFSGDDGPGPKAQLSQPHSLTFDANGDLLVCDIVNHRIRKIDMKSGVITTYAGTGEKKPTPDGSPLTGTPLNGPRAMAVANDGKIWLALREGNAVLKIDPVEKKLYHIAGTGKSGFTGNGGPAKDATLAGPKCVALDKAGNVYLADTESHSIRMINTSTGKLEVIVGDGQKGNGPDGMALRCRLARPHGVFVDRDGSIYIGDSENHCIRRVLP